MYRSARLAINGTGADPGTSVSLRGNAAELPADYYSVQSMDFDFRWRDKDYGDCVMEDWYFSVTLNDNHVPPAQIKFSFWRNYVYFTADRIYFGYYNSWVYIYKNDLGQAIFHHTICGGLVETPLAGDFDTVVARFKAAMVDCNSTVKDSVVYKFSLGEVTSKWLDEHQPPSTTVAFA
jgi:hypothetical protein